MNNPFIQNNPANTIKKGLSLHDSAVKRLAVLLYNEPDGSVFRIKVNGGGCSGFQYNFSFDTETSTDDFTLSENGVTLACDTESLSYVDGGEVSFVDSLSGQYFTIQNPNATSNCGCGTSFSI